MFYVNREANSRWIHIGRRRDANVGNILEPGQLPPVGRVEQQVAGMSVRLLAGFGNHVQNLNVIGFAALERRRPTSLTGDQVADSTPDVARLQANARPAFAMSASTPLTESPESGSAGTHGHRWCPPTPAIDPRGPPLRPWLEEPRGRVRTGRMTRASPPPLEYFADALLEVRHADPGKGRGSRRPTSWIAAMVLS